MQQWRHQIRPEAEKVLMQHKFAEFHDAKRIRSISLLSFSRKKKNWSPFKKISTLIVNNLRTGFEILVTKTESYSTIIKTFWWILSSLDGIIALLIRIGKGKWTLKSQKLIPPKSKRSQANDSASDYDTQSITVQAIIHDP